MNKINDGGPAFPTYASDHRGAACNTTFEPKGGVTLRDYFAAKAMQGLLSVPGEYSADADTSTPMATWDDFAAGAYELADAMLKAREGK